jgi:hypothetical protein
LFVETLFVEEVSMAKDPTSGKPAKAPKGEKGDKPAKSPKAEKGEKPAKAA